MLKHMLVLHITTPDFVEYGISKWQEEVLRLNLGCNNSHHLLDRLHMDLHGNKEEFDLLKPTHKFFLMATSEDQCIKVNTTDSPSIICHTTFSKGELLTTHLRLCRDNHSITHSTNKGVQFSNEYAIFLHLHNKPPIHKIYRVIHHYHTKPHSNSRFNNSTLHKSKTQQPSIKHPLNMQQNFKAGESTPNGLATT
jgi:hypothetical protein